MLCLAAIQRGRCISDEPKLEPEENDFHKLMSLMFRLEAAAEDAKKRGKWKEAHYFLLQAIVIGVRQTAISASENVLATAATRVMVAENALSNFRLLAKALDALGVEDYGEEDEEDETPTP